MVDWHNRRICNRSRHFRNFCNRYSPYTWIPFETIRRIQYAVACLVFRRLSILFIRTYVRQRDGALEYLTIRFPHAAIYSLGVLPVLRLKNLTKCCE